MATDLPWNGAVRRKAPSEGLSGLVSSVSVKATGAARALGSGPAQGSGATGGTVQGANVAATPIEPKPTGPAVRPNGRLKIPTT
jgi:hypothetical protein